MGRWGDKANHHAGNVGEGGLGYVKGVGEGECYICGTEGEAGTMQAPRQQQEEA